MRAWMMALAVVATAAPAAAQEEQERRPEGRAQLEAAWYDNWISGVHFRLDPDGRVFLLVPETNEKTGRREFKAYQAESMDAFKRRHAEVARRHDLETLFGMSEERPDDGQNPEQRQFQSREELKRWVERQEQALQQKLRKWREQDEATGRRDQDPGLYGEERPRGGRGEGKSLGIMVAPVDPALRTQLRLREGQGLVVHRVEQGSLAEKAGLRKYDVIAELKGRSVGDFQEFRGQLEQALSKGEGFELGVIRDGRRQTVTVQPEREGREAK